MKPRRRRGALVVAGMASCAVALIVACTFPEATFVPDDGTRPGDESTGEGSTVDADASAFEDVSNDVQGVLIDGGDPDALIVKEDGGKVDASGCTTCDCDDDTYWDTTKAGCNTPDAGPHDCDDKDSRTHPNQGYLLAKGEPPRNGDWNCVSGVEKFYNPNLKCTDLPAGSACDSAFGFEDNPACGATGTFVTCKSVGGVLGLLRTCAVGSRALDTKQGCK